MSLKIIAEYIQLLIEFNGKRSKICGPGAGRAHVQQDNASLH